jgi:hypothetical protein
LWLLGVWSSIYNQRKFKSSYRYTHVSYTNKSNYG